MRNAFAAFSVLLMFFASEALLAAGAIKPGLWEMNMKSEAMKAMPSLSPEQLEQMRKAGVNMPQMQSGGIVTKVCISKEMAERDQPPQMAQDESGCQTKNFQRKGNSYSIDVVCDSAQMKGTGIVKGTYLSDSSFNSTYDFKGTAQGRPVNQHFESSGKRIGADCGSVKPAGNTAKK